MKKQKGVLTFLFLMVVDEFETFPILSRVTGDNLSTGCVYCQNTAVYIVANK